MKPFKFRVWNIGLNKFKEYLYLVKYDDEDCAFRCFSLSEGIFVGLLSQILNTRLNIKFFGNKYKNPELLDDLK